MRQAWRRWARAAKGGRPATMTWLCPLVLALLVAGCSVPGAATPPPSPPPSHVPSPPATVPPSAATASLPTPGPADPAVLLPEGMAPRDQVRADLDGDGREEVVILSAVGQIEGLLSARAMALFVLKPTADGYTLAWLSGDLAGERGERLRVGDLNGDGRPEVASVQAMGAAGATLYILAWRGSGPSEGYGLLRPGGGYFDGRDGFGEVGARLEDVDGDGKMEVLGDYGPAASQTDVYRWNGTAYQYVEAPG